MDQRSDAVERDLKDIEETRERIRRRVQSFESDMQANFERMKSSWERTLRGTSHLVRDIAEQAAPRLNPVRHIGEHPWFGLGGAVLVGFAIGLLEAQSRRSRVYPYAPPKAQGVPVMPSDRNGGNGKPKAGVYPFYPERDVRSMSSGLLSGIVNELQSELQSEIRRSKQVLTLTLRDFVQGLFKQVVPTLLQSLEGSRGRSR